MTSQTRKLASKTPHIKPAKKRFARRGRRGAGMLDSGLVLLLFVVVVAGLLMTFNGLMCVFRSIRPPIPTTCAHLFRSIRPPVMRCCEAAFFSYQV